MPGKRPRQIQRTTSMLQLGGDGGCAAMGAMFSRSAPESFHKDAGASLHGNAGALSPPPRQEQLDSMEISTGAANAGAFIEGNLNIMPVDGSVEESLFTSHTGQLGTLYPAYQASHLDQYPAHLGAHHQAAHSSHLNPPAHSKSMASTVIFLRGHVAPGSAQPMHSFLDVCFLCSKRLGHDRDVFIYRGDRAYCSVECRHSQILADERREKCGRTVVKERVDVITPASDAPTSTGQVETAAAA